jgi:hypothetical protein
MLMRVLFALALVVGTVSLASANRPAPYPECLPCDVR